jgi:hypothetical protein
LVREEKIRAVFTQKKPGVLFPLVFKRFDRELAGWEVPGRS